MGSQRANCRCELPSHYVKTSQRRCSDTDWLKDDIKAGEIWAIALSEDGRYLAGTTYDGRVNVWDTETLTASEKGTAEKVREYETKGSFGMSIDLVGVLSRAVTDVQIPLTACSLLTAHSRCPDIRTAQFTSLTIAQDA